MKSTLQAIGGFAIALLFIGAAITLGFFFIKGGVWLGERILPILFVSTQWVLVACLFVFVPLAVFHSTRPFAGMALFISSYVFGLTLWIAGLLFSYLLWGWVAVFIGLFMMGVGVVPIALLATLFNGLWGPFFGLLLLGVATYGSRFMAMYVIGKYEEGITEA